jgi:hypothetical protein
MFLVRRANRRKRALIDILMIIHGFSSTFKARQIAACGIDEADAINDCPAKLIWSYS